MNRPLRGPLNPTAVDHSTDAWDSIDWLVKHVPESNGRVGTIGISYNGFTALMSLVGPHPALKAVVPINPMVDGWKGDDWFHNGAFRQEMLSSSTARPPTAAPTSNGFPAYDDYATYLRYGSAGAYGRAIGMEQLPFWRRLTSHPAYDGYLAGPGARPHPRPAAADRPDPARRQLVGPRGHLRRDRGVRGGQGEPRNAHLVLGPWYHGQVNGAASNLGPLEWGQDTGRWFRAKSCSPSSTSI